MASALPTRERIEVDADSKELFVPHLGMTLRTLLGAAAARQGDSTDPRWHINYKGARIGEIRLKVFHDPRD